jgi:hypothetical protein
MRALRHGIERGDLVPLGVGCSLTLAVVVATAHGGAKLGAGVSVALAAFLVLVAAWLFVPHIVVGLSIPLFALLPTAKVMVSPWLGPLKDFVTLAAAGAILITVIQRGKRPGASPVDQLLIILVLAFASLYVIDLGGRISGDQHRIAWAQGVRLVGEPLILLVAGLTLRYPRKTLEIGVVSLIGTGVFVALYGIYQQHVGGAGLVNLGYSYRHEVRTIGGRLRSFGTLDDPFAYAALLMLAICAALFWMRRGPLKVAFISVMTIGLTLSYVRSAILISVALLAIWLLSLGRVVLGLLLLTATAAAALAFLFAIAGANETRSVRAAPNTYVTLNGRTTVWSTVFAHPSKIPFGLGVGKVGTAAQRAQFGVVADPYKVQSQVVAVDSGYFAAVADVGMVGFVILLALLSRLVVLGIGATRKPGPAGWLILGWLAVLLIDAVTRASFTGFPTAFLGLLLVGAGIAASAQPSTGIHGR